jgi:outer membrane protein insertion porin family
MSARPVTQWMPEGLLGALLVALLAWPCARAAAQVPTPPAGPPPPDAGAPASAVEPAGAAGAHAAGPDPAAAAFVAARDAGLVRSPPAFEGSERPTALKYLLERVEIVGNRSTKRDLIKKFVPLEVGSAFDVTDPEIEALRYRLLGTGWYDSVHLRLQRGSQPGWAVLVIEVEERRTLVFQQFSAGVGWSVEQVHPSDGPNAEPSRRAEPYLGLALAETNFLGTGKTVGGEFLVARDQQGVALVYHDPVVRSSHWGFRTRATFVNGQEYFGGDKNVQVTSGCDPDAPDRGDPCQVTPAAAVVEYWRTGLSLGTARDVGSFTRLTLDWRGDVVVVPDGGLPAAATEIRGRGPGPGVQHAIDFAIEPGNSFVSMLSVGFIYDKRDSAILPTRGLLSTFAGDLASPLIGSDYEFVRLQASIHRWFPLRWGHTIRTGAFAGAVFGYAPFFYKFFVTDLTDLQPSRILGLNLDHRPAPNMFGVLSVCKAFDSDCGTAVAQMRQEELAARVDVEYVWPLARGRRKFLKNADAYFLMGLYGLADPKDLQLAIPGYSGVARLPIDLTLDFGVRLDTEIGVFQVGLAKFLWLPL